MNATRAVLATLLIVSGCGSCQRTEEWGQGGGAKAPAGSAADKPQAAPAADKAAAPAGGGAAKVEAGRPAAPGAQPPAAAPGAQPEEEDCVVVVDVNPDFGPPPLSVAFTAEAECGAQPTYKWDFGDGSAASSEQNPSHTYAKEGDYTASITVSSPGGATATDEIDIFVEEE